MRVQFADEEYRRRRLRQDNPLDIATVPIAGLAEKRLGPVIVEAGGEGKLVAVGVPAGERTGRLTDVGLGVGPVPKVNSSITSRA